MKKMETDILIVGVGSAGFGALYNALLHGKGKYNIIAIDKNPGMGGTATFGGVNNWEPGIGGLGIHKQLAKAMLKDKTACVGVSTNVLDERVRWGNSVPCDDPYEMTLSRTKPLEGGVRRLHYEPEALDKQMQILVKPFGNFEMFFNTEFVSAESSNGKIQTVTVKDKITNEEMEIHPKLVLDCSADIVVARNSGCKTEIGEDSHSLYNEPHAPEKGNFIVNGITQMFFVTPCYKEYIQEIPEEYQDVDVSEWMNTVRETNYPVCCHYYYTNGDISVNMLPTMQGREFMDLGEEQARSICIARAYHYWRWLQIEKGFMGYRIKYFLPMLGIRETYRLVGKYVLKEQDLFEGFTQQPYKEELIAFSDHPCDTHGNTSVKGDVLKSLNKPYGVPYRCMLTNEVSNLLVACRGASFSHIAASSARLIRMMMAMGEAAGTAAVMALEEGLGLADVNVGDLRVVTLAES